ncbi:MAG: GntR family transcriptional regulator [Actinobacteria bacterium]|nr:GntR family transcriptional regulator [Actinomycetota bacterium]
MSPQSRTGLAGARPGNAAETAADAIRAALTTGELRVGAPVREEDWAARLSLSRTPIREAIKRLVIEGILVRDGRTAYVFQPSLDDLLDIYNVRLPLETLAARRAAEQGGPELAKGLMERFKRIRGRQTDNDWYHDHEDFHLFLFAGAGSPRLSSTIATLRAQSEPYVRFAVTADLKFRNESNTQHREMVNLVRKHDGDGIAALVEDHLMRTRRELDKLMAAGWTGGMVPPIPAKRG